MDFRRLRQKCRRLTIQWHPDKVNRFNPAPAELDLFRAKCTQISQGLTNILNYLNSREAAHKALMAEGKGDNVERSKKNEDNSDLDPCNLLRNNYPQGMP